MNQLHVTTCNTSVLETDQAGAGRQIAQSVKYAQCPSSQVKESQHNAGRDRLELAKESCQMDKGYQRETLSLKIR